MVYINPNSKAGRLGPILALMKLLEVRKSDGIPDIAFGAGLPDAEVDPKVMEAMLEAVQNPKSPYLKYDPKSVLNEEQLVPDIAAFHERQLGVKFDAKEVKIAPGSTPVLAAMSYVTQKPGKVALFLDPAYPLMSLPVERMGGRVDRTARLVTRLDIGKDGKPYQSNRWQIDYASVRKALANNRSKATLLYLNFPSNPTGYAPTPEEYRQLAEALLEDIKSRKKHGLHTMAILEDIAYATMMYDGKKYYSLNNAIQDLRTQTNNEERLDLLNELEQSVVVAHSFSKAFAVAGDRVAYFASKNPELLTAVYNQIIDVILTPGRGTLAAMKGALAKAEVDQESMKQYELRLRYLERGLNNVTEKWLGGQQPDFAKVNGEAEFIQRQLPIPAKADAGFFATTFFNFLRGRKVDEATVAKLKRQIARIPNPTLHQEFGEIFKGGKINNTVDAALWLAEKANIIAIPIAPRDPQDKNIRLRFSVGQTSIETIKKALDQLEAAFKGLEPPVEEIPHTTVRSHARA
jgi:aspartate/methionine/tyrosine aminotransferase